jgi:tetratricopeptide (TPR) repeat protein
LAKGDPDRAISDYDQVIAIDPNYAIAYYNRALAYRAKGDLERVISDCSLAIALYPKYRNAYFDRGYAYRTKGDFDRAIADYDQMIALDPKDREAYSNRATAYLSKGDYRRAIADIDLTQALPWLAVVVVLALGGWLCLRTDTHAWWSGRTMIDICEQQVVEMQHRNAALERIAAALERH